MDDKLNTQELMEIAGLMNVSLAQLYKLLSGIDKTRDNICELASRRATIAHDEYIEARRVEDSVHNYIEARIEASGS